MGGRRAIGLRGGIALVLVAVSAVDARGDDGWIELTGPEGFAAWKSPTADWAHTSSVRLDPGNPRRFAYEPGRGEIIVNGPTGRTKDIVTERSFGDVEIHLEFNLPKGTNSGVKFQGVYEIQIADSFGKAKVTASDCGGIYPRAEMLPKYHHIDEGTPPKVNACKAPGDWQTLDIVFRAPRVDAEGNKTADARIVRATLNGQVVQDDVALATPTGNNWRKKAVPTGPILIQGDHGPVAFRNVRARPWVESAAKP